MAAVLGVVAFVVALVGLLVTLGNAGYLAMLSSAASKRGLSGEATMDYVKGRRALAGGLAVVALLGLLIVVGSGPVGDVFGLLLGGGSGLAGYRALNSTRQRFRSGS